MARVHVSSYLLAKTRHMCRVTCNNVNISLTAVTKLEQTTHQNKQVFGYYQKNMVSCSLISLSYALSRLVSGHVQPQYPVSSLYQLQVLRPWTGTHLADTWPAIPMSKMNTLLRSMYATSSINVPTIAPQSPVASRCPSILRAQEAPKASPTPRSIGLMWSYP